MACNDCGSGGKILKYDSAPGTQGFNGWTPELANVVDGLRVVEQVVDWFGGTGTKPAFGVYVGPIGFVDDISLAVNIRGAQGLVGPAGPVGPVGGIGTGTPGLGVPTGGLKSEVLRKKSNTSFDTEWGNEYKTTSITTIDPSALTLGSTTGFTVLDTMAYTPKETVYAYSIATPATYIMGEVVSYAASVLTIKVLQKSGSASANDWQLNLASNELPDYTGVVTRSRLIATSGVLAWEPEGVTTNSNQFWISPTGNDTTGDGSVNKPWATFSKARVEILNVANTTGAVITLIVIGGAYANTANMAIQKTSGAYYNYTIYSFPGVVVDQSINAFYNNVSINGHLDVYGSPSIIAATGIAGSYAVRIATKRNGTIQTIQAHQYGRIMCSGSTLALYAGSNVNGVNGVAFAYIKAQQIFGASSPVVTFEGADGIVGFSCAQLSCSLSSGVGVLINGIGAVSIWDTKSGPQFVDQPFVDYKIQSKALFSSAWTSTQAGGGQRGGIYLNRCVSYSRGASYTNGTRTGNATHYFLDIRGAGNLNDSSLIEDCKSMNSTITQGCFIIGTSVADTINVRNCLEGNSDAATIGSPVINAVGGASTIASSPVAFYIAPLVTI